MKETVETAPAVRKLAKVSIMQSKRLLRDLEQQKPKRQKRDSHAKPMVDEKGKKVTIKGTLGNVLSGWLTAEGVIPSSYHTRRTPNQTREIVLCGNRGAGSPVFLFPHTLLRVIYRKRLHRTVWGGG